jgi:hypothetical protein
MIVILASSPFYYASEAMSWLQKLSVICWQYAVELYTYKILSGYEVNYKQAVHILRK